MMSKGEGEWKERGNVWIYLMIFAAFSSDQCFDDFRFGTRTAFRRYRRLSAVHGCLWTRQTRTFTTERTVTAWRRWGTFAPDEYPKVPVPRHSDPCCYWSLAMQQWRRHAGTKKNEQPHEHQKIEQENKGMILWDFCDLQRVPYLPQPLIGGFQGTAAEVRVAETDGQVSFVPTTETRRKLSHLIQDQKDQMWWSRRSGQRDKQGHWRSLMRRLWFWYPRNLQPRCRLFDGGRRTTTSGYPRGRKQSALCFFRPSTRHPRIKCWLAFDSGIECVWVGRSTMNCEGPKLSLPHEKSSTSALIKRMHRLPMKRACVWMPMGRQAVLTADAGKGQAPHPLFGAIKRAECTVQDQAPVVCNEAIQLFVPGATAKDEASMWRHWHGNWALPPPIREKQFQRRKPMKQTNLKERRNKNEMDSLSNSRCSDLTIFAGGVQVVADERK